MNILNLFGQYSEQNAIAKKMYELVTYQLPILDESYYENTFYSTYPNFLQSNKVLNQSLKRELNPIIIDSNLMIGGANAILFPADYRQGVTQAQAILNTNGSICFAYIVEFDGTNTNYNSIRVNDLQEVVALTNGTAVISNDEEMFTFISAQIQESIANLPE